MAFNKQVVTNASLSEFLKVEEGTSLGMTELQSRLYDRLYRLGMVRNLDGTRARRRRARDRIRDKNKRKR